MSEADDDAWVLFFENGALVKRRPWCDCKKIGHGFTKRSDGVWVRPCCNRRPKDTWLKWHDDPIPPDYLTGKEQAKSSQSEQPKKKSTKKKEKSRG
jgi:hypothetical protein